jgi:Zn ribbon nucleic-acid-binding protein
VVVARTAARKFNVNMAPISCDGRVGCILYDSYVLEEGKRISCAFFLTDSCQFQSTVRSKISQSQVDELDKLSGNACPRCGARTLNIFYEDDVDLQLGATCDQCGLKGLFVSGKLVQLATA